MMAEAMPSNCQWHGYGIGIGDTADCDARHLLVHAALPCQSSLVDLNGQAMTREVEGGFPAPKFDGTLTPEAPALRSVLQADAQVACEEQGSRLGDWYAVYEGDTQLVNRLYYQCIG